MTFPLKTNKQKYFFGLGKQIDADAGHNKKGKHLKFRMEPIYFVLMYACLGLGPTLGQLYSRVNPKFGHYSLRAKEDDGPSECEPGSLNDCQIQDKAPEQGPNESSCPTGTSCRPISTCGSYVDEISSCVQADGKPGLCCAHVEMKAIKYGVMKEAEYFLTPIGPHQRSIVEDMEKSLKTQGLQFANDVRNFAKSKSVTNLPVNSALFGHFQQVKPSKKTQELAMNATMDAWTAKNLVASGLVRDMSQDSSIDNSRERAFIPNCPPDPICDASSKFRMFDGSCNNLKNPKFGMAGTPYQRVLLNSYSDGFFSPRSFSVTGAPLPSPRLASLIISRTISSPSTSLTAMFPAFGQFMVHDILNTPVSDDGSGRPPVCCPLNVAKTEAASLICLPIPVPRSDPVMGQFKDCISFVRSLGGVRMDCKSGPLEQVNQVTHYIDGSQIYGSNDFDDRNLRLGFGGLLAFQSGTDGMMLPSDNSGQRCGPRIGTCFRAGDGRVNQQANLAFMHTLFLREHNRIATQLSRLNPGWQDEKIFQETRRIVIAELQHIVYNEWLPNILGQKLMTSLGLVPLTSGFFNGYKDDINPNIVNAFAAAALRLHTLVPSLIRIINSINSNFQSIFELKSNFGNMDIVAGQISGIARGLLANAAENVDRNFAGDLRDELFGNRPNGLDLLAININRGRDHGLPGYIKYRQLCGNTKVTTFEDLAKNMVDTNIEVLKSIYASPDDIDLLPGALLESVSFEGALMGNTFICLIADQFLRLKLSDRFFYETGGQPGSFTQDQLNDIRKISLSRIICDNVPNVGTVQAMAFIKPDPQKNPSLNCARIPGINLNLWIEK